jgi:hypothetical protein
LQCTLPSLVKRREAKQQPSVLAFRKQIDLGTEVLPERKNYKSKNGDNNRARELGPILRRINDTVPFRKRSDLVSFVNWKRNAAAPIHRWLRYREAYSPHLITKLSLGEKILDLSVAVAPF